MSEIEEFKSPCRWTQSVGLCFDLHDHVYTTLTARDCSSCAMAETKKRPHADDVEQSLPKKRAVSEDKPSASPVNGLASHLDEPKDGDNLEVVPAHKQRQHPPDLSLLLHRCSVRMPSTDE